MATAQINKWLREKAKVFLIVICVVIMVVWLVMPGMTSRTGRQKGSAGTVFGQSVSLSEVQATAKLLKAYSPNPDAVDIDRMAAPAYQSVVFAMEADRYGIQISEEQVSQFLRRQFTGADGIFNSAAYELFLSKNEFQRQDFEAAIQRQLKIMIMENVIRDSVILPDEEAWAMYARENEKVKTAFVQLAAKDLTPLVDVDDTALGEFYDAHANLVPKASADGVGYLAPERVKVEYVVLPYEKFNDQVEVTPEEIASYYEKNKGQFVKKEDASEKPQDTEVNDTANETAGDVAVSENEGETTDEQGNASVEMAEQPDTAAPAYKSLEEVSGEIKAILTREKSMELANAEIKKINDVIGERLQVPFGSSQVRTIGLKSIADEFGLTYKETGFMTQMEAFEELLQDDWMIMTGIFGQGVGAVNKPKGPIAVTNGRAIYQITGVQQPAPSPYEEVKSKVLDDFRLQAAMSLATEIASKAEQADSLDAAEAIVKEEITKRLQEKRISPLSPEFLYTRDESGFFARSAERATGLPDNANHMNFIATAFALKDGEVGMAGEKTGDNSVYLLQTIDWEAAKRADFEEKKSSLMAQYLGQKQNAVMNDWLESVRRRANPDAKAMKFLGQLPLWAALKN